MTVSKFPKKNTINVVVCSEGDPHIHANAKELKLPKDMTDVPILTLVKEDNNPVYYNWLTVSYVELVTDEEVNEMAEEESEDENDEV